MADEEDHILDMLTDEERAGLEESDFEEGHTGDEASAGENESGQIGNGGDEGASAPDAAQAAAALTADGNQPDAEAVVAADATIEDKKPTEAAAAPTVDLNAINTQLDEIKSSRNELLQQYDDGDLTADEYAAKLSEMDDQADHLKRDLFVAQDQINKSAEDWNSTVKGYVKEFPGLAATETVEAFDRAVRSQAAMFPNLGNRELLERAHDTLINFAADLGLQDVPVRQAKGPDPKPATKAEQNAAQPNPMREPPKTLASASASDISGGNDSPLAALEALVESGDSDAIEAALMKLPPEQRDEFSSMYIG